MTSRDAFSACHPLVNFLYFGMVLVFSMFFMHPVCLAASLAAALAYALYLRGGRSLRRDLLLILPLVLLTALLNPAFNHQGMTILAYFPNGNPLTGESLWYGLAAGTMVAAVILWFVCYNAVMTSDKFVYLFGRVIPSLSLVLSMILRFVPKFKAQLESVRRAQLGLGRQMRGGSLLARARRGLTLFSILITWALENAIETADSMRARGYGLPGRTAFSIYRWDRRDSLILAFLLLTGGYILLGKVLGALSWRYFPTIKGALTGPYTLSLYLAYFALLLFPVALDLREDYRWIRLRSRI